MNHGTRKILTGACAAAVLVAAFFLTIAKGDSSSADDQPNSTIVRKTVMADAGPEGLSPTLKVRPNTTEKRTVKRKTPQGAAAEIAQRKGTGRVRTPKVRPQVAPLY